MTLPGDLHLVVQHAYQNNAGTPLACGLPADYLWRRAPAADGRGLPRFCLPSPARRFCVI